MDKQDYDYYSVRGSINEIKSGLGDNDTRNRGDRGDRERKRERRDGEAGRRFGVSADWKAFGKHCD